MNNRKSFADHVISFNQSLSYTDRLPEGFGVMNPFQEEPAVNELMQQFYRKFYDDHLARKFLIGINPGRHGAGVTGIPFTDTKRLSQLCGIPTELKSTHEVSAQFVYDMIEAYGGVNTFYADVYIHSLFPLALVRLNDKGTWVNCNYYDDKALAAQLADFMIKQLKEQIDFGIDTQTAYILGKKNAVFFEKINRREKLFKKTVILPHPRYIQQYKSAHRAEYIKMYIEALQK